MTAPTTIHVVMAATMYEGSDPVRGFPTREPADAFAKQCTDYEATRRASPGQHAETDEFMAWYHGDEVWKELHPAAPHSGRAYHVIELPFDAPTDAAAIRREAYERAARMCERMACAPEFEPEIQDRMLRAAAITIRHFDPDTTE